MTGLLGLELVEVVFELQSGEHTSFDIDGFSLFSSVMEDLGDLEEKIKVLIYVTRLY